MVLVDTSLWIQHLMGRTAHGDRLAQLLRKGQVVGHPLVYGELLIGDKGARETFLRNYAVLPQLQQAPHTEVVELVRSNKLHGRGAGWIDVHLLASAIMTSTPLWTADPRLDQLAREFKIAYTP